MLSCWSKLNVATWEKFKYKNKNPNHLFKYIQHIFIKQKTMLYALLLSYNGVGKIPILKDNK